MNRLIIAGAKGGSARTTTVAELAGAWQRSRIPCGVIDLAPTPAASLYASPGDVAFIVAGRNAPTPIAAEALMLAHRGKAAVTLIDTGRLDDPAIDAWVPSCRGIILTTGADPHSLSALPAIWRALDHLKSLNPALQFLGFLPVGVRPQQQRTLEVARRSMPDAFLPVAIPRDETIWKAAQARYVTGFGASAASPARNAYSELAAHLAARLDLAPIAAEPAAGPAERGVLGKLWKLAARAIRGEVRVVKEAGA